MCISSNLHSASNYDHPCSIIGSLFPLFLSHHWFWWLLTFVGVSRSSRRDHIYRILRDTWNGRGRKSTVSPALLVVLGSKANSTGQGSRLKPFIHEGQRFFLSPSPLSPTPMPCNISEVTVHLKIVAKKRTSPPNMARPLSSCDVPFSVMSSQLVQPLSFHLTICCQFYALFKLTLLFIPTSFPSGV